MPAFANLTDAARAFFAEQLETTTSVESIQSQIGKLSNDEHRVLQEAASRPPKTNAEHARLGRLLTRDEAFVQRFVERAFDPSSESFGRCTELGLHKYRNVMHKWVKAALDEEVGRAAVRVCREVLAATRYAQES